MLVGVRILVDPDDPDDLARVHGLQDALSLRAASARPFTPTDYDTKSLDHTRAMLLELMRDISGFSGAFGSRDQVNPVHHLLGCAAGWGGLPESEAVYLNMDPGLPVGDYQLTIRGVPVDAFWSITVYDAEGYFIANDRNVYSVNSVNAATNPDGSITVRFGTCNDDTTNCLPIADGWNYTVRLYRPRQVVVDRSYVFPAPERVQ